MKLILPLLFLILLVTSSCKDKQTTVTTPPATTTGSTGPSIANTVGFGVLSKLKGIWNGSVNSTTGLGNYPEWIVDFRPISENQISAKNELDTLNDIFMSFFIAKYNNEYRVAFRNGGSFVGMERVSYFLADSVSESTSKSYYRFSEILKGKSRAYTEVVLKNDSLIIKSYTNKYNTQPSPTPHMAWLAKLQDSTSCQASVTNFNFPVKSETKDFSNTFVGQTETIFYATSGAPAGDPYPETAQPYLGQTTVTYVHSASYTPIASRKVFLIVSTQPLFSGTTLNLKNRSRYVVLAANDLNFTFNYMHPGTYYAYAMYDNDGNGAINTGDWFSAANTSFTLGALSTTTVNATINFQVP